MKEAIACAIVVTGILFSPQASAEEGNADGILECVGPFLEGEDGQLGKYYIGGSEDRYGIWTPLPSIEPNDDALTPGTAAGVFWQCTVHGLETVCIVYASYDQMVQIARIPGGCPSEPSPLFR